MTVLVTGATGLIGSHVVDLLVARGENTRALVQHGENVDHLERKRVDICWGDMKDRASLSAAVTGADRVIHCAARTGPWGPKEEYEAINIRGVEDLIDVSLAAGVRRFVHVSSILVIGADVGGIADETAPLHIEPHNPYSWSKVQGEQVVKRMIMERGAPITIVRPGWVYGRRDNGSFARFAAMVQRGKMIMIGSGNNHVPLIYVTDVAQGILQAITVDQAIGKTFFLVNDEPVTQQEYLGAIAAELGVPPPRLHVPYPLALLLGSVAEGIFHLADQRRSPPLTRYGAQLLGGENRLTISSAREVIGFKPQVNLIQGVRESVEWFRGIN
jgi:nucleoside-diphosphate-sugar epimerase